MRLDSSVSPKKSTEPILLEPAEIEALKLVELQELLLKAEKFAYSNSKTSQFILIVNDLILKENF
jgi:predicted DNA-binding protein (UPF0251 family)